MVFSRKNKNDIPTYEVIKEDQISKLSSENNFVRLIGVPLEFLDLKIYSQKNNLQVKNEINNEKESERNILEETNTQTNKEKYKTKSKFDYKFFSSSKGNIEETTACFLMLSSMLDVPLRKDSVKKILEENINKKTNEIGLDLCAAIAESIGLKTQIARIPKNVFQRSLTPLFLRIKIKKYISALMCKMNLLSSVIRMMRLKKYH